MNLFDQLDVSQVKKIDVTSILFEMRRVASVEQLWVNKECMCVLMIERLNKVTVRMTSCSEKIHILAYQ